MQAQRYGAKERDTDKWTFIMKIFTGVIAAIIVNGFVSYIAMQRASIENGVRFASHIQDYDKFASAMYALQKSNEERFKEHSVRIRMLENGNTRLEERSSITLTYVKEIKEKLDTFTPVVNRTDRHLDNLHK